MVVKVVFVGNPLAGDDGIGPFLFNALHDNEELKSVELMELGVAGIDLVAYLQDDDSLIIIDAVHAKSDVGDVVLISEADLISDQKILSPHDFGLEQTLQLLKMYKPSIKNISIIGIKVNAVKSFSNELSDELMFRINSIKEDVLRSILKIVSEVNG